MPRVMFFSPADLSAINNGASVSTWAMMNALNKLGISVSAVYGVVDSRKNLRTAVPSGSFTLNQQQKSESPENKIFIATSAESVVLSNNSYESTDGGIFRHEVYLRSDSTESLNTDRHHLLNAFVKCLRSFQPDLVCGFGGDWVTRAAFEVAQSQGVKTWFLLHNYKYVSKQSFRFVDKVLVPNKFSANYYKDLLGLDCVIFPNVLDPYRYSCADDEVDPQFITFVNPSFEKGVFLFARIAHEIGLRRPDIRFLVVEGRGTEKTLSSCGLNLSRSGNIYIHETTPTPRVYWRYTKLCIMPSLWWECQPLVAIEAMSNGIPIVGANKGGLPETVADGGILVDLPQGLTPRTRILPNGEDCSSWIDSLLRLWDDNALYAKLSGLAASRSQFWSQENSLSRLSEIFEDFDHIKFAGANTLGDKSLGFDGRLTPYHSHSINQPADVNNPVIFVLSYFGTGNLGDAIQTIAVSRFLNGKVLGYYRDSPFPIGMQFAAKPILLLNGWLDRPIVQEGFRILQAGVHYSFKDTKLKKWSLPKSDIVGCRDPATHEDCLKLGIASEIIGCPTLTFNKYTGIRNGEYSIDCNKGGMVLSQFIDNEIPWSMQWSLAMERLELLKTASVIHTTRLHVLLPCLAFGTPVTFHQTERNLSDSRRLSLLEYLGINFNQAITLDVSKIASNYKLFLNSILPSSGSVKYPNFPGVDHYKF